jgi:hypothetical protein
MHRKAYFNKPRVYSNDPDFFTTSESKFFPCWIDTDHWNDLQTDEIIGVECDLQEYKEILSYLRELQSTYSNCEVFVNEKTLTHTFNPVSTRTCDYCCGTYCCDGCCCCTCSTFSFVPLDELIKKYTRYCEQLDEHLEFLDSLLLNSHGDYDQRDYAILPNKNSKNTTHRISREKSLPKTRLERYIKKQVFFKKSRKIEPVKEEPAFFKKSRKIEPVKEEPVKKEPVKEDFNHLYYLDKDDYHPLDDDYRPLDDDYDLFEDDDDPFDKDERDLKMFRHTMMYFY